MTQHHTKMMFNAESKKSTASEKSSKNNLSTCPVLLAACTPASSDEMSRRCEDRWQLTGKTLVIGRKEPSELVMDDEWMSGEHFRIFKDGDFFIEDLGSKNGTFLNGMPLRPGMKQPLKEAAVIRAGHSVFVFHLDAKDLLAPPPSNTFDLAGCFHLAPLISRLKKVAAGSAHVLLSGPTGSGKEPAAKAIAALSQKEIVIHNSALFSTEDEAISSLFGVAGGVFTGVIERTGFIEHANGKILFLDEAHHLFSRVQKSLLRVLEDMKITPVGRSQCTRTHVKVRFILASNDLSASYGIEHDLAARLEVIKIPSLKERTADIPSIFRYLLRQTASEAGLDADRLISVVRVDCMEALCLDGFSKENVRGLIKLSRDIVGEIQMQEEDVDADWALLVYRVFRRRFEENPALYRKNTYRDSPKKPDANWDEARDTGLPPATTKLIVEHYYARQGNVTSIKEELDAAGISLSRRRISKVLDLLNLPRVKRERNSGRFRFNKPGK